MSASQAPALTAIAFQLLAVLETYERDVAAMLKGPLDPEAYRRVSKHIDLMRMYAAELPVLSVAWVEVMIRHFELTHGLWRAQHAPETIDLGELHTQLRDAAHRLSQKCMQLLSKN
jgi:hypothetical protein